MSKSAYGMQGVFVLPPLIQNEFYHTRKHGISQFKGLTLDKTHCMFIDKNKQHKMIPNTFIDLVQFLGTTKVAQMAARQENIDNGIGL